MSLEDFKTEIESISGVSTATFLDDDILQVKWFGEPADYNSKIRDLREKHPSVTQVEAPDGEPTKTPDAMPISYYSE